MLIYLETQTSIQHSVSNAIPARTIGKDQEDLRRRSLEDWLPMGHDFHFTFKKIKIEKLCYAGDGIRTRERPTSSRVIHDFESHSELFLLFQEFFKALHAFGCPFFHPCLEHAVTILHCLEEICDRQFRLAFELFEPRCFK